MPPANRSKDPFWMSSYQAAEMLGVSLTKVYDLAKKGELPFYQHSKRSEMRFSRGDLSRFMSSSKTPKMMQNAKKAAIEFLGREKYNYNGKVPSYMIWEEIEGASFNNNAEETDTLDVLFEGWRRMVKLNNTKLEIARLRREGKI